MVVTFIFKYKSPTVTVVTFITVTKSSTNKTYMRSCAPVCYAKIMVVSFNRIVLGSVYVVSTMFSASAVTLTTVLNPDGDLAKASYQELHTVSVQYPVNSEIATLFKQSPKTVHIRASSEMLANLPQENTVAMRKLIDQVNRDFANKKSLVRAR
jgi:hypothetical protein